MTQLEIPRAQVKGRLSTGSGKSGSSINGGKSADKSAPSPSKVLLRQGSSTLSRQGSSNSKGDLKAKSPQSPDRKPLKRKSTKEQFVDLTAAAEATPKCGKEDSPEKIIRGLSALNQVPDLTKSASTFTLHKLTSCGTQDLPSLISEGEDEDQEKGPTDKQREENKDRKEKKKANSQIPRAVSSNSRKLQHFDANTFWKVHETEMQEERNRRKKAEYEASELRHQLEELLLEREKKDNKSKSLSSSSRSIRTESSESQADSVRKHFKKELNCRGQHDLKKFITDNNVHCCDCCLSRSGKRFQLPTKSTMYGCRFCDFDLCKVCWAQKKKMGV